MALPRADQYRGATISCIKHFASQAPLFSLVRVPVPSPCSPYHSDPSQRKPHNHASTHVQGVKAAEISAWSQCFLRRNACEGFTEASIGPSYRFIDLLTRSGEDARLVNVMKLQFGGKEAVSGLGMLYSPCELYCGIHYKTQALESIYSMKIALEEAYITIAVDVDESKSHTLYTSSPLRPNCTSM